MYVDFDYFSAIYPAIDEPTFNRFLYSAERIVDNHTTGIDGIRKLQEYFPDNAYDAEAVKRCICELIQSLYALEQIENAIGFKIGTDGEVKSGLVSSVSSGRESISYATNSQTAKDKAATDPREKKRLIKSIVESNLSGTKDSRGCHLLYMGSYV